MSIRRRMFRWIGPQTENPETHFAEASQKTTREGGSTNHHQKRPPSGDKKIALLRRHGLC